MTDGHKQDHQDCLLWHECHDFKEAQFHFQNQSTIFFKKETKVL